MMEQRQVPRRFLGEDVERCAGQATLVERLVQRLLVDQSAACGAHQAGAGFHAGNRRPAKDAAGLGRQRQMQADVVAAREQRFPGSGLGAAGADGVIVEIGIESQS